jgi:hypothetical protein
MRLGARNTISRADLAEFMLALAADGRYPREAPMVSYRPGQRMANSASATRYWPRAACQ